MSTADQAVATVFTQTQWPQLLALDSMTGSRIVVRGMRTLGGQDMAALVMDGEDLTPFMEVAALHMIVDSLHRVTSAVVAQQAKRKATQ